MDEVIQYNLENYPYLKAFLPFTIFITETDLSRFRSDFKIKCFDKELSFTLLKKFIQEPYYYEYVKSLFSDETREIWIRSIKKGDLIGNIAVNKVELISGLNKVMSITNNNGTFSNEEINRYRNLLEEVSFERFLDKINNNSYNVTIDGTDYSIFISDLIDFINLPDEDFYRICNSNEIIEIKGIPKDRFVYAVYKFFKENNVFEKYLMTDNILRHYSAIKEMKIIDIEAFNTFITTIDPHINEIEINDELKNAIFKDMPEELSTFEKAIYIYIKMCKLLTYDDEFLAFNQKGEIAKIHEDIKRIPTITPLNNKIVCYEFNSIYGKLLGELGIKYLSIEDIGDSYGDGHASLEFRCDKYLVSADSVTNILHGDLTQGKINQPLLGFICKNKNEDTQAEFKKVVDKVYQLINEKQEDLDSFNDILKEYESYQKTIEIPLEERLDILVTKANRNDLEGVDTLSYILQLEKILFKKDGNFDIKVIRNNETNDQSKKAMASAIVIIYDTEEAEFKYYMYNPHERLIPILPKTLQEKFDNGTYDIIDRKIPGIKHTKGGREL